MFRTFEISDARFERDGLRWVTVKSAALKGRGDICVWVPTKGPPAGMVLLLHGVYGSHWAWALKGGAHRTAERLVAAGDIPPLVLAMPSDGLWGDGSGYRAHGGRDFERWIVEEVPAAVERAVPGLGAGTPRFVAGLSMGGYGALRLACRHPAAFAAASGHSSITRFEQMAAFVEEPLSAYADPAGEPDVVDEAFARRDRLPRLRFDCGTEDPLIEPNRTLHRQLEAAGIAHDYAEFPGGHEWPYWEKHLEDSLRFFAARR
ncbi:MAG: esterase family protein [Verrucomicrobiales bacterium]|nr:esterase family protein [Verrucomicrobiales bacterium]